MIHVTAVSADALTLAIAAYAAVVATVGAAVQLASHRARRTKLKLRRRVDRAPDPDLEGVSRTVLVTIVINQSDHPVKIKSLELDAQRLADSPVHLATPFVDGGTWPQEIGPRDAAEFSVFGKTLAEGGLDRNKGLRARVKTTDGRIATSYKTPADFLMYEPLSFDRVGGKDRLERGEVRH
jgi:hypothetical protein